MKKIIFAIEIMLMAISGCRMSAYASIEVDQELSFDLEITNQTKTQWIQSSFYSENLKMDWTYEVYLPPSYNDSEEQTYPVFYLLHGVWGSAGNWRSAANLFSNSDALAEMIGKEFIIVTVDGMNSFYIDKNIYMESAIMDELLPYIESQYRVSVLREDTFIGGLSMGGYGAARLALIYPQVFGGAILMSPAVWTDPCADDGGLVYEDMGLFMASDGSFDQASWEAFHPAACIEDFNSQNLPVKFYIATGDEDQIVDIHNVDQFAQKLEATDTAEVKYVVKNGFEHNWKLWKEQILYGIMYCLDRGDSVNEQTDNSFEQEQLAEMKYTFPRKETDYLYYMEYTDYSPLMNPENASPVFTGCCSDIRNGNYFGRNLDLHYCSTPEFVICIKGSENRLGSISVCANPLITPNVDEMTEENFLTLPNIANDGINEKGVLISENVVLTDGIDSRTGTNPGKEKILAAYVTRYILDHAESADHAIELLENLDIIGGFQQYGLHWMIADPEDTYIVEIIDQKLVVKKNEYFYMTNFYLNYGPVIDEQVAAGRVYKGLPELTLGAIGVERWNYIREHYEETNSVSGMMGILCSVRASRPYELDGDERRFTDFTNQELTIDHSEDEFVQEYEKQCEMHARQDRQNPSGDWITWHSSVYDIEKKTLHICSQEDYNVELEYQLAE